MQALQGVPAPGVTIYLKFRNVSWTAFAHLTAVDSATLGANQQAADEP